MKLIICMLVILSVWQTSYAQAPVAYGPETKMIPIEWATTTTSTIGLQTHQGFQIGVGQILNGKINTPKPLGQVINHGLIELKSGDIFYSEEIQFVVTPSGEFTGSSRSKFGNPVGRAPHTPK